MKSCYLWLPSSSVKCFVIACGNLKTVLITNSKIANYCTTTFRNLCRVSWYAVIHFVYIADRTDAVLCWVAGGSIPLGRLWPAGAATILSLWWHGEPLPYICYTFPSGQDECIATFTIIRIGISLIVLVQLVSKCSIVPYVLKKSHQHRACIYRKTFWSVLNFERLSSQGKIKAKHIDSDNTMHYFHLLFF